VIKGCNIFFGKKLANTCIFVGGHIIVQQEKISRAVKGTILYSFIKFYIYCFSLWYEFLVHYTLRVKKNYQHGLKTMLIMRDLWNFSFFGRGDVSPTHSELVRFVLGS